MNERISNDLGTAMRINDISYHVYTNLCMEAFLPMMCLMIDNWSAVNGKDPVELVNLMTEMVSSVNAELGPMEVMA